MSNRIIMLTGFLMLASITISVVGCNENISEPDSNAGSFGTDVIVEPIDVNEKNVTSFARIKDSSGKIVGYRVEMELTSRSGKFDILVDLDEKACVIDAVVTNYPARRGRQIRSKAFTSQFKGKCSGDALELGKDIDAVSGATLSGKSMTEGVKKAVILAKNAGINATGPNL